MEYDGAKLPYTIWSKDGVEHNNPPNYLNDLNAMHEAETTLQHYGHFTDKLAQVMKVNRGAISLVGATAPQRSEAFLKTINLWEETK
jgi:hypothetical protein